VKLKLKPDYYAQVGFEPNFCVQTGSEAHSASCTMGTGGLLLGAKERPEREADHSSPFSAEVENEELYLLSPQLPLWRVAGLIYEFITFIYSFNYQ
jgi:hypothetical protein